MIIVNITAIIIIVLDNPYIDPESLYSIILSKLDDSLILMFTIEMLLNIISYSFIFDNIENSNPYDNDKDLREESEKIRRDSKNIQRILNKHKSKLILYIFS